MLNFALVNQLRRHIEILLLSNDCVIVPDFGGFVAHWVPARYDEEDCAFLPPMRTLGFNSQLRMNDSLLAQSYAEANDISYPEALRLIEHDTEEVRKELENKGTYTLDGLGTLTVNIDGRYEFEPFKAGLLTPDIYALPAIEFKRLHDERTIVQQEEAQETEEAVVTPALLDFMDNDEEIAKVIHIKMSWIRNAVAVAAAIVAFFLFATPVLNSDLDNKTMSQLQGNLLYKLMPKDTNVAPPVQQVAAQESKTTEPQTVAVTLPVQKEEAKQEKAKPIEAVKTGTKAATYCIVVASQVKKSNAEAYVEHLHKQGYSEAEVFVHNDIVRVICGTFNTESEAYSRLNKLNDKEEFAEAWVYKKKSV